MNSRNSVWICALVLTVGGCNSRDQSTRTAPSVVPTAAAATLERAPEAPPDKKPSLPATPAPAPRVELEISAKASTMTYDKTSFTVPAGSEVHLVMKNSKPGTLAHNWVLVKSGTEAHVALGQAPCSSPLGCRWRMSACAWHRFQ